MMAQQTSSLASWRVPNRETKMEVESCLEAENLAHNLARRILIDKRILRTLRKPGRSPRLEVSNASRKQSFKDS